MTTSTMSALRVADLVAALATPDGGFTVDPFTGEPLSSGYAVSIDPACEAVLAQVQESDLQEFLLTRAATLGLPNRVFGGWHDPADHRIYLDVSVVVESRELAWQLAREYGQLAFFDFNTRTSVGA